MTIKSFHIKIKHSDESDFNIFLCTYKTIKNVTQAIEDFHFNIAISNIRTLFNALNLYITKTNDKKIIKKFCISNFLILLNPICPHICEEAWEILGNKKSISNSPWPKVDLQYLNDNQVVLPIQVNGKRRGEIKISKSLSSKEVENLVLKHQNIVKFLTQTPKKLFIFQTKLLILLYENYLSNFNSITLNFACSNLNSTNNPPLINLLIPQEKYSLILKHHFYKNFKTYDKKLAKFIVETNLSFKKSNTLTVRGNKKLYIVKGTVTFKIFDKLKTKIIKSGSISSSINTGNVSSLYSVDENNNFVKERLSKYLASKLYRTILLNIKYSEN